MKLLPRFKSSKLSGLIPLTLHGSACQYSFSNAVTFVESKISSGRPVDVGSGGKVNNVDSPLNES